VNALDRAIKTAPSLTEFAARIGVSPQVVAMWKSRGTIPAERVLAIEAATLDEATGAPRVTRHDLRPDLYPDEREAA
jgi:DNA-binding transcriptional regulator YdaS (Cro superfamily)